jgi:hypothetical protein
MPVEKLRSTSRSNITWDMVSSFSIVLLFRTIRSLFSDFQNLCNGGHCAAT